MRFALCYAFWSSCDKRQIAHCQRQYLFILVTGMNTSEPSLSKSESNKMEASSANNNADFENTNLTLLHLKLKNEADKIRKWHLSVENSLKSKETQIVTDGETISSLRKSQLDLKLSVESLSSQLKDEVQTRDDFGAK